MSVHDMILVGIVRAGAAAVGSTNAVWISQVNDNFHKFLTSLYFCWLGGLGSPRSFVRPSISYKKGAFRDRDVILDRSWCAIPIVALFAVVIPVWLSATLSMRRFFCRIVFFACVYSYTHTVVVSTPFAIPNDDPKGWRVPQHSGSAGTIWLPILVYCYW